MENQQLKKVKLKKVLTVSLLTLGLGIIGIAKANIIMTGCGSSTFCTLAELIGGASIEVDGVNFNNFSSSALNRDQIQISGIGGGTNVGLKFQDDGDNWKLTGVGGTHSLNYNFGYDVAVSGSSVIIGRTIETTGGYSQQSSTEWRVSSVLEVFGGLTRSIRDNDATYRPSNPYSNSDSFPLQAGLNFLTNEIDISLTSHNQGSTAEIDSFQQSFTLDTAAVPLPAAVWLLGSGVIFLSGFRRKKAA